eukprot:gene7768-9898_t
MNLAIASRSGAYMVLKQIDLHAISGLQLLAIAPKAQLNAAGKWEVTVVGTPNGDSKLLFDLVRADGKLTGQMSNPAEPTAGKVPVTVEE